MANKSDASPGAGKRQRRQRISAATDTLALLDQQAKVVRAELVGLQQNLADVQLRLVGARTNELREANEQLALAAMHAESIGAKAVSDLDQVARKSQRDPLTDTPNRALMEGGGNFQFHSDPLTRGRGPSPSQWVSRNEVLPDEQCAAMDNLREANQQLVMAILTAQELEEQIQLKHARQVKFMAMVAHELRNPLTPIRTAAGLLKRVHSTELVGDVQVLIEEQVVRMSRLVEDLLDSTRVSAGTFRMEWSNVQLPRILERAVARCRPEMEARHQRLTLHIPSGAPDMLGDPMRLAQIFCNLLDNASKYTQDGGEIAVTVEPSDDAVRVRVSDNGMGIAPTALTSIFDLFVQDERALTICRGGLGIGLAVVRDLVEAHGGTITAHSSGENLGSEFVVTLPIRGPEERRRGRAR
jgi:signal transduction histidine kinase